MFKKIDQFLQQSTFNIIGRFTTNDVWIVIMTKAIKI